MSPPLLADVTALMLRPASDWHVGAGHGVPGGVDAVVRRDHDGLPYVPGTTLTGLLRDACATVARALDGGTEGRWRAWHTVVFGSAPNGSGADRAPVPAAVGVGPARLSAALRRKLTDDPAVARALTTVRVGVAIDPTTGRAEDDMLRTVELARGGLSLHGEVTLRGIDGPEARTAVSALLMLGAAWCDRMGGDRRRGPGAVRIDLSGQDPRAWATWLATAGWVPPVPVTSRPAAVAAEPMTTDDDWVELELEVTTSGPLRASAGTAGNIERGHDHLPGAGLLPWLSDRWGPDLVRSAIAGSALVAHNLYPGVDGTRGLPVPFTASRAKDGSGDVAFGVPEPGRRSLRDGWTVSAASESMPVVARGECTVQVSHNTVDRARQRPTGPGGIYELEVIPAGRVLRGRLLVTTSVVERLRERHGPRWAELLAGPARLGARRRGEYGSVTVAVTGPAAPAVPEPPDGGFRIWLAADALVLGPGLRPSADPEDLRSELATRLAVPGLAFASVQARTRRRDGWQGAWQLPKDSQVAIGAGTVIDVTLPPGSRVDLAGWRELAVHGIGERRAEGFGEVVLDPLLLAASGRAARDIAPESPPATTPDGELDEQDRLPLELLRRTVRREKIVDAVATTRADGRVRKLRAALGALSASQRGTWRAVTADAAVAGDLDRVVSVARRWQDNAGSHRRNQREVALLVVGLAGAPDAADHTGTVDHVLGHEALPPEDRAFALAALVADVLADLEHPESPEER